MMAIKNFTKIRKGMLAASVLSLTCALGGVGTIAAPVASAVSNDDGPITFTEGRNGNDYYKYPDSCTVTAVQGKDEDTRYGMTVFCGDTGKFSEYLFQYTNSYGENIRTTKHVGVEWFQQVRILPGDDPFIQTDLVITPKD